MYLGMDRGMLGRGCCMCAKTAVLQISYSQVHFADTAHRRGQRPSGYGGKYCVFDKITWRK